MKQYTFKFTHRTFRLLLALTCVLPALLQQTATAQEKTISQKDYKNNIHFNITNPLIFGGKSYVLGF